MTAALHIATDDAADERPVSREATLSSSHASQVLRDALRLNLAAGRWTIAQLSDALDAGHRLYQWYEGRQTLPFDLGLALAKALGDATVERVMACIGYTIARPPEREGTAPHRVLAEGCRFQACLSDMLADFRLDHRERRELAPLARGYAAKLIELASDCEVER